jgi:hypothetical protein
METLSWVRLILFWSLLVVAHIFFVLTIVKGYSKKNEFEIDSNAASNLLDEFPGQRSRFQPGEFLSRS